jgi:CheY-like chemotaxis protein
MGLHSSTADGERRLLLVNCYDDMTRVLQRMLQMDGYDVDTAGTLDAGRVLLEQRPYGLLLCRNAMPDGEGPALIEFAWSRYALPAVAITGALTPEKMAARCHPDALRGVLYMPFTRDDLLLAVAKGLGRPDIAGPDERGHYRVIPATSCPDCHGAGQIALLVTRRPCPRCAGRGLLYQGSETANRTTGDTSAPVRSASPAARRSP